MVTIFNIFVNHSYVILIKDIISLMKVKSMTKHELANGILRCYRVKFKKILETSIY